jgi:hypothetical protein
MKLTLEISIPGNGSRYALEREISDVVSTMHEGNAATFKRVSTDSYGKTTVKWKITDTAEPVTERDDDVYGDCRP